MTSDPRLEQRLRELRPLGEAVCAALSKEVRRLGLPVDELRMPGLDAAQYQLSRDPASGEHSLVGTWRDDRGAKRGGIVFHADGSFFAEVDVVRPHPTDPRWFVEAMTAWGRDAVIKTEPRLLPALT